MEEIIQEKISADHLLYVSLKYTKTCDVIMNLIVRWRRMIEVSIEEILTDAGVLTADGKKLYDAAERARRVEITTFLSRSVSEDDGKNEEKNG